MTARKSVDDAAYSAAVAERRNQNIAFLNAVRVPAWVHRVDLAADYRDTARDFGEEAAARHCRRLKAEMEAFA